MAKIDRFNGNLKAFASEALGTERTIFGSTSQGDTLDENITSELLRGWGIVGVNENPSKQDFNGLAYTLGQLLAYLHQSGIPEWNGIQEFHADSYTNRAGVLYVCLTNDHVSVTPPESDATNWRLLRSADVFYDNSTSGLTAERVQAAIDEMYERISPQSWQDVSGSRSTGVVYTNSTGRPIDVAITVNAEDSADQTTSITFNLNGSQFTDFLQRVPGDTSTNRHGIYFYVRIPDGDNYELVSVSGLDSVTWWELR